MQQIPDQCAVVSMCTPSNRAATPPHQKLLRDATIEAFLIRGAPGSGSRTSVAHVLHISSTPSRTLKCLARAERDL